MTAITTIQDHSHVYLFKPADSFITEHPQTLYVWLRPTEITEITITSSISTTVIKNTNINVTEVEEAYYDRYYSGTQFPNEVVKTYQRVSFPYYFTGSNFALLTFTYTYSYTCPSEIETYITNLLSEGTSHADIIALLEPKRYLNTDIQNWIDAIEASSSSIVSEETTTFKWPVSQMVVPVWSNDNE